MKIDRFVKVMLVLIAMLLAINCAKDLNLSSNSGGNTNNLSASRGNSGNPPANVGSTQNAAPTNAVAVNSSPSVFETSVEAATPPAFLQVGKSYSCGMHGAQAGSVSFTVVEIQNTGWVKTNSGRWVNTNACVWIDAS